MRKLLSCGIAVFAVVLVICATTISAVAVAQPGASEQPSAETGTVPGIELEKPSASAQKTQGKAQIETVFPAKSSSAPANMNNGTAVQSPAPTAEKELKPDYTQKEYRALTESAPAEETPESKSPKIIIAAVFLIVLLSLLFFMLKHRKKADTNALHSDSEKGNPNKGSQLGGPEAEGKKKQYADKEDE
jgi:hypothetical protein